MYTARATARADLWQMARGAEGDHTVALGHVAHQTMSGLSGEETARGALVKIGGLDRRDPLITAATERRNAWVELYMD